MNQINEENEKLRDNWRKEKKVDNYNSYFHTSYDEELSWPYRFPVSLFVVEKRSDKIVITFTKTLVSNPTTEEEKYLVKIGKTYSSAGFIERDSIIHISTINDKHIDQILEEISNFGIPTNFSLTHHDLHTLPVFKQEFTTECEEFDEDYDGYVNPSYTQCYDTPFIELIWEPKSTEKKIDNNK